MHYSHPFIGDNDYLKKEISFLNQNDELVQVKESSRIKVINSYYQAGTDGTHKNVYTRKAILLRLENVLETIPSSLGLIIFDVFRSMTTQVAMYNNFYSTISRENPSFSKEKLHTETKKFAAHPNEPSRFKIPPHNTGGSVDLALFDLTTNETLDFGTEFDNLTELARTNFFDTNEYPDFDPSRIHIIKKNRRMLFNAMTQNGFINFENEWWHFSLGDCLWQQAMNSNWHYESLETEVYQNELL